MDGWRLAANLTGVYGIYCIDLPAGVHHNAISFHLEFFMAHLTVQEVIEKIRQNYPLSQDQRAKGQRAQVMQMEYQPHRPEFYIPRLARCIVNLRFGDLPKES